MTSRTTAQTPDSSLSPAHPRLVPQQAHELHRRGGGAGVVVLSGGGQGDAFTSAHNHSRKLPKDHHDKGQPRHRRIRHDLCGRDSL
ncbi:hypothetical protein FQP90_21200 [Paenarthrobacter nitroguajacolicus]|uniref:Uncharacterized protein n=1 Tax=Paenarthrobacter nitroguajacolicus TaxID=211146 RepID=A0A558GNN9_PAENT|nr:hypothetical protein FQP90_21200 [Paenarthrobacter nitroguajacolicus]